MYNGMRTLDRVNDRIWDHVEDGVIRKVKNTFHSHIGKNVTNIVWNLVVENVWNATERIDAIRDDIWDIGVEDMEARVTKSQLEAAYMALERL
jgi:hypothetical protein